MLRLLSITSARGVTSPVELGSTCVVMSLQLDADQGGTATLQLEDARTDVVAGQVRTFDGLKGRLPAFTRVTGGTVRIIYRDGVIPE